MEFTKETQGIYSYLVYEIESGEKTDEFSLGMLANNRIPGVLPIIFTQMDDKKYFKYNISSKVSASEFLAGTVTKKRVLGVFESLAEAFISADEYMINEKGLILDLNYIYADVSTSKAEMVYLPLLSVDESPKSINMFLKEIMFSTQFDQTENCDYVAQIINYLNSSTAFNIYEFKKLINQLQIPEMEKEKRPISQQPLPVQEKERKINVEKKEFQSAPQSIIPQEANKVIKPQQNIKSAQLKPKVEVPGINPVDPMKTKPEKQMSMFNLLMHYSKENKELYKQQKLEKSQNVEKKKENINGNKKNKQPTFSVPGAEFVVPGMETAFEQPASPSIPTQSQKGEEVSKANPVISKESVTGSEPIIQPRKEYSGVPANFGETTVLGNGMTTGETTVLSASQVTKQQSMPHLIRIKNNEKIPINKPRYRIGKEKSYVDYFIGDNTAISRSHADIINNDGVYVIVDMNSTNHTYVNNEMIQSGMEVELKHGDKLRLANEEFEFRLY